MFNQTLESSETEPSYANEIETYGETYYDDAASQTEQNNQYRYGKLEYKYDGVMVETENGLDLECIGPDGPYRMIEGWKGDDGAIKMSREDLAGILIQLFTQPNRVEKISRVATETEEYDIVTVYKANGHNVEVKAYRLEQNENTESYEKKISSIPSIPYSENATQASEFGGDEESWRSAENLEQPDRDAEKFYARESIFDQENLKSENDIGISLKISTEQTAAQLNYPDNSGSNIPKIISLLHAFDKASFDETAEPEDIGPPMEAQKLSREYIQ